ncbi:nad-dependent 15-hydroxyprostaglandin dehydrogenase [Ophiostoma piceae UAMH 11346]|uniref:Nad-dependent 15-hydroxyprostaglandin dehydrogenase n=1 Tax=Ophiostoma piceae (strain UAMH 11346) TaxID=1262450 RepID=S3CPE1_OPHP1|nr:nad-dependent 15-hydroxyprostaglandin dehydrogenase [Ophiostoma piceae UAMH 11346]
MVVGKFSLNGKIVDVTGAGSGINLAFAKSAEAQGAKSIIADLRLAEDAQQFVAQTQCNYTVVFVRCDVTRRADLEDLVVQSEKQWGDVSDVYVTGAGAFEPDWSSFWDDTEDDGYKQVEINVNHP